MSGYDMGFDILLTENLWPLNNEETDADKQYNLEIQFDWNIEAASWEH